MSKVAIEGNASGTGTLTIAAPNTNTNRTITLPDATGTIDRLNRAGNVLQVVQTVISSASSLVSNGGSVSVSGFAATITPLFTTSKILLRAQISYGCSSTTYGVFFRRNGTDIGLGDASGSRQRVTIPLGFVTDGNQSNSFILEFLDSPSSVSAQTYQLFALNDNANALFLNRSEFDNNDVRGKRSISTITLMEIAA